VTERQLLLVRHPETEANVNGRWVGRGNAPFTDLGEAQVEAVVARIVEFRPDAVYSSPLDRARIPAQRAAAAFGVPHVVDERLHELDFGEAEGFTLDEAADAGIEFHFKAEDRPVAAGGESRRDIMDRTAAFLDETLADHERVAVVTHGGVFRSAVVHLLGLPLDAIWAFNIRNAQIAEITLGEDWTRLESFYQAEA